MKKDLKLTEDKDKILKYSRQKFHKEGFYKTSMDEIAGELQMSKKTIYKFFSSKEKLLEEICTDTASEITEKIDSIVDSKENVVIKFVKILDMYSNFLMNISEKWLRDLRIHTPYLKKNIDEKRTEKMNKVLIKLLAQGKKEKLIENYPSPIIITSFIASIMSVINPDFLVNNKFSMHNAFRITYEMLMNGILTQKGKEKFNKTKALLAKEIKL